MKNAFSHEVLGSVLEFRWTVSRGRDTYGYNICSLYVDGKKFSSCNGGGYDMKGTSLGAWIEKRLDLFPGVLRLASPAHRLPRCSSSFYGLYFWDQKKKTWRKHYRQGLQVHLDGGCGFGSMENILRALGLRLRFVTESRNRSIYTVEAVKK